MKTLGLAAAVGGMGFFLVCQTAFAHVVVRPREAGVGSFQNFDVGVPSERDSATVMVRLVIPPGLEFVTPNVKPGWDIEVKSDEKSAQITEIIWKNGAIPGHYRDDFLFSAKVPPQETKLQWKAYQVYEDGSVVSWDNMPDAEQPRTADGKPDFSSIGPYSETEIIDDLKPDSVPTASGNQTFPLLFSIIAIIISGIALLRQRR